MSKTPLFFMIAGEASGDLLGASLMKALKERTGGKVRFVGIGGPRMAEEGIDLFFPQAELAHFGLFEMLRHIPHLLRRIRQTRAEVRRLRPTALITIDAPDFCFRVAKSLVDTDIPLIHYVAPTVWAWRPGRAQKIARFLTHLMVLLPFEPPYFTHEGLDTTFVGHPIVESGAGHGDPIRFRTRHKIPNNAELVAVLPGSRMSEVSRLLPIFGAALSELRFQHPKLHAVIPLVPHLANYVKRETKNWPTPVTFTEDDQDKYDAFSASRAAMACSGTVAIELALSHLPAVIAYKVSSLTYYLYRRLIQVRFANLVNIMHDKMIVPELLQQECTPDRLAFTLHQLLADDEVREEQLKSLDETAAWFGQGEFIPSERAAETVLKVVS